MKVIAAIAGALLGVGAAWLLFSKKKGADGLTPQQAATLAANPYNVVNSAAPITILNPPAPNGAPVSIYDAPYSDMLKNAAYNIATSTAAAAARAAVSAPAAAFNQCPDATTKQMLVASFAAIGNPLDSAVFPFPSKYIDQTLSDDLTKMLPAIDMLISLQSALSWQTWLAQNKPKFTLRYFNLDLSELAKSLKLQNKISYFKAFVSNLLAVHAALNDEIFKRAVATLKAQGYKFIEYP